MRHSQDPRLPRCSRAGGRTGRNAALALCSRSLRDVHDHVERASAGRRRSPVQGQPAWGEGRRTLTPRRAIPLFSTGTLATLAYVPDHIVLAMAGTWLLGSALAWWVGLLGLAVFLVVLACYREALRVGPQEGADYPMVHRQLGPRAGLLMGSHLLWGEILALAMAACAAAVLAGALFPALMPLRMWVAIGIISVLALLNVSGVGPKISSSSVVIIPVFVVALVLVVLAGAVQALTGQLSQAPSATYELSRELQASVSSGLGALLIFAGAASPWLVSLTGLSSVTRAKPTFEPPREGNARTTLAALGALILLPGLAMMLLTRATHVSAVILDDPSEQGIFSAAAPSIVQVTTAITKATPWAVIALALVMVGVLVLSMNSNVMRLPLLAGQLGRERYLPRPVGQRGDRLVFSHAIAVEWAAAVVVVLGAGGNIYRILPLYVLCLLLVFVLNQWALVRYWNKRLSVATDPAERKQIRRSQGIARVGLIILGGVYVLVAATDIPQGGWITLVVCGVACLLMTAIHKHYTRVGQELQVEDFHDSQALPAHVHAIVLFSRVHRATLRALSYAQSTHPTLLEAVSVETGDGGTSELLDEWEQRDIHVPLTILSAGKRDVVGAVTQYVKEIRRSSPRDLVVVFLPEYIPSRWWHHLLHNRATTRLKAALLRMPGVVVASVPWQLGAGQESASIPTPSGASAWPARSPEGEVQ